LYRKNELLLRNDQTAYSVIELNAYSATVSVLNGELIPTKNFHVNLHHQTCTCGHYQQTGVPCKHGIKFIQFAKKKADASYFGPICLVVNYLKCFGNIDTFHILLPFISDFATNEMSCTIAPVAKVDFVSSMSTSRIRSGGDGAFGGGVSVKSSKRSEKFMCGSCNKLISRETKHPPSACESFLRKNSPSPNYSSSLDPSLTGKKHKQSLNYDDSIEPLERSVRGRGEFIDWNAFENVVPGNDLLITKEEF